MLGETDNGDFGAKTGKEILLHKKCENAVKIEKSVNTEFFLQKNG